MEIIQVAREDYKNKEALFNKHFKASKVYFVDEGGKSDEAWKGVSEIIEEIDIKDYTLVHASATGTTAKGLREGIKKAEGKIDIHSIAVLKNKEEQSKYIDDSSVQLHMNYTFGGYAKTNNELLAFCKEFTSSTGILVDPIYTGKALFGLRDLINNGKFQNEKPIVFLHTGGMLGVLSKSMLDKFT